MFGLSMKIVSADVSPLILYCGSLSRLTSAATGAKRFMAPRHARTRMAAFHEPKRTSNSQHRTINTQRLSKCTPLDVRSWMLVVGCSRSEEHTSELQSRRDLVC